MSFAIFSASKTLQGLHPFRKNLCTIFVFFWDRRINVICHPRPRLRREAGACQRRRGPARCGHRSRHRDLRRRNLAGARSQSRLACAHRSPSHAHEVMPARLLPRDRYESAHITPSTAGGRPEPPQAGRTRRHRRPKNP